MRGFDTMLNDAERERLEILLEELGEAQQCVGKILRHGYESYNPVVNAEMTNRRELEREIGDVIFAIEILTDARDVNAKEILMRKTRKRESIKQWLHFQVKRPPMTKP